MADVKKCKRCGEVKELSTDFYPRNKRSKDGFDGRCKACWKIIQKEKRARKLSGATAESHMSNNAKKVIKRAKAEKSGGVKKLDYKVKTQERSTLEFAPADLVVHSLKRFSDLPKKEDGAEFMEWEGSLEEGLQWFQIRYGKLPDAIYVPARYFLRVDEPKVKPNKKKE